MSEHRYLLAALLGLLSACELSFDPSLDGKRCDSEGACVAGYVCSPLGICEREGQLDASPSATAPVADAGPDARVETPSDAAIVLDAAEHQTSVPAATTNEPDTVVDVTPDSGTAVADAGHAGVDAGAAIAPDAAAPAGAEPDAGLDAAIPPPPTMPPGVMTPVVPPPPGGGAPPPPGMMGQPPGPAHGCSAGRVKCGGECVDLEEDRDHCGVCDNACRKSESCDDGVCRKLSP
jgi:hypothetical protein